MNIQIFGTRKCHETLKAERFFKERKILFHFRDLIEKGISKGELENISIQIPLEELFDKDGKEYKKKNLAFMKFDIKEALLENALLLKTPVVRNGKSVTIGFQPQVWENWIKQG